MTSFSLPSSNDSLAFIVNFNRILKVDWRQNTVAVSFRDKIVILGNVEWNTRRESGAYIDIHKDHAASWSVINCFLTLVTDKEYWLYVLSKKFCRTACRRIKLSSPFIIPWWPVETMSTRVHPLFLFLLTGKQPPLQRERALHYWRQTLHI